MSNTNESGAPEVNIEIVKEVEVTADSSVQKFDLEMIRSFPKAMRKVNLNVSPYRLSNSAAESLAIQTLHISPYGLEFQAPADWKEGSLLKIQINIPDYWERKQKFVEYRRIDTPGAFQILGKVVSVEEQGKRKKQKLVTVQTVNIDEIDEKVLLSFLEEG